MTGFARGLVLGIGLVMAGAVQAQQAQPADQIERLTDRLVEMMPIGKIFDMAAAENPLWPMAERPNALDAKQLECVRGELSSTGYRRSKRAEVEAYAKSHTSRVADDLKLLEAGAASLMGKLVIGGATAAQTGKAFDEHEVLASATTEQALSFMKFVTDPNFAELRKLSGMGDALDPTRSSTENEKAGHQLGMSLGAQHVIKAMGACSIPPSAYL